MDSKEEATKRNRITLYLLLAGSAVLLVPLLVLLYLRSTEGGPGSGDAAARAFARRANRADRIKAAQAPAPDILGGAAGGASGGSAAPGDSLGFVKSNPDFLPPPQPSTETVKAPEPASAPKKEIAKAEPAPQKAKAKAGPKPFMQPRLQGTKFSSTNFGKGFNSGSQRGGQMGGKGGMPGGMPQMPGGAGMPDMSGMMQGMMPGGAGAAGGGGAGMPDMSSLMKGMMPGPSAVGGAAPPTAGAAKTQPGTTQK
jgi:hypothetical protein